mgnify:CR=1 FL=1
MIPIEAAINGRSDLRLGVLFAFHPGTQILAMVEMRIIRSADDAVFDRRRIDARQRFFTTEQYDVLRNWTRFVVDPDTLARLTQFNITDPRILAWIHFLTSFSSPDSSGFGGFGGPKGPDGDSGGSGPDSGGSASPMEISVGS